MTNQSPNPLPSDAAVSQLIDSLNQIRDAWMQLSLELRDMQFEMDTAQRKEAIERAHVLVQKVK